MNKMKSESLSRGDVDTYGHPQKPEWVPRPWGGHGTIRPVLACPRLLSVLVVDDDRDTADSLSLLVKLWGHLVRAAYDGATALDLIAASQPNVVLLDIAMPEMNGFQLAKKLRRQTDFKKTVLVAVTGYGEQEYRRRWEGAFDYYFVKPLEPSTLENLLMHEQDRLRKLPRSTL